MPPTLSAVILASGVNPWEWHPHPDVWLLIAVLVGGYHWMLRTVGPRRVTPGEAVVAGRQRAAFLAGVATLWAAADWPVHDLAEDYLLSVHMVQHLLLTLVAPGLLMVGLPGWAWRWVLDVRPIGAIVRKLGRPLVAGLIFNTVVVFSHWPVMVNGALRSEPMHFGVHAVLVTTALLMWFPVLNRQPGFPMLTYPGRMVYLFLQSVVPTVPASFLTFAEGVIYEFYGDAPRAFGMSAVADQQLAGGIMKIAGGLVLWSVIIVMFFRWYTESLAPDGGLTEGDLTWDDVERELERTRPGP